MPTATFDRPLAELEGVAQITLSTTAAHLAVPGDVQGAKFYGSAQWRLKLCPKLLHAIVYKAATGVYTDYLANVTDQSSSTHMPLDGLLATDIVYLGFSGPTRGAYFDIGTNVQAEAATLDVEYCTTAVAPGATIAFTDVAGDSDGTTSGGAALAVDGLYTWTLPTDWVRSTLGTSTTPLFRKCWWIRFKPSATLSATVDINEIIPAAKNTNYDWNEATTTYVYHLNTVEVGALEYKATSATPTLNIAWLKY